MQLTRARQLEGVSHSNHRKIDRFANCHVNLQDQILGNHSKRGQQMAIKKAEMQSIEAHRDVCMRENLRVLEEREREGMCPAAYSLRGVARAATSSEVANRRAGGVSGCSRGPKLKWT